MNPRSPSTSPYWKAILLAALLLGPKVITAQTAPTNSSSPRQVEEEPVRLSDFEVQANPDDDYAASNVISGTKFNTKLMELPRKVDVITDKFIQDLGTTNLLEALRYNAAIQLDTAEGVEAEEPQIVIRGYRADTTYVNGFTSNQVVDRLFIDRIEVIKGPSSIFSGPIEPGGTMNTITKKPSNRSAGTAFFSVGSFDRYRGEATYTGPVNPAKTITTRVAAGYENYGSYLEFVESQRKIFGASLQWRPTPATSILGEVRYIQTRQNPGDPIAYVNSTVTQILSDVRRDFNRNGPDAFYNLDQWQANVEGTHIFNDTWSFRAGVMGQYRTLGQLSNNGASTVILVNSSGVAGRSAARTGTYRNEDENYLFTISAQAQLMGKFNWTPNVQQRVLLGAEANHGYTHGKTQQLALGRINIDNPQPDSAYSYGNYAAYPTLTSTETWGRNYGFPLNNIFTLFKGRVILLNGVRYSWVDNASRNRVTGVYGLKTEPSSLVSGHGITYQILPERLAVYASYAESFVPQTGAAFDGTPFDPIEGKGLDYGIKFDVFSGRLSGTIGGYKNQRDKGLSRDTDHPGFFVQERNQDSQGFEAGIHIRPFKNYQLILNYGYCDIVTTGDPQAFVNNSRQRNVPRHQGNVWNRYRFTEGPLKGLALGVGVIRLGNRRGNDTRADIPGLQLPAFTKVDGSISYDFKLFGHRAALQVSVSNALDRTFIDQYRYYSAPRSYTTSLRYHF